MGPNVSRIESLMGINGPFIALCCTYYTDNLSEDLLYMLKEPKPLSSLATATVLDVCTFKRIEDALITYI